MSKNTYLTPVVKFFTPNIIGAGMSKDTYLTYSQWEKLHKNRIKKQIRKHIKDFFYWSAVAIVLYSIPIAMLGDWIVRGY